MKRYKKLFSIVTVVLVLFALSMTGSAAHKHSFGSWKETKKATCTAAGKKVRVCSIRGCTQKEEAVIKALDHNFGDWKTTKKATCTASGKKEKSCSRKGCHEKKTGTVGALGHSFGDWKVTKKSTCQVNGVKERTCQRKGCKEKRTEIVPIDKEKGHKWSHANEWRETTGCLHKVLVKCELCKKTIQVGSGWAGADCVGRDKWKLVIPATCSSFGKETNVCKYCGRDMKRSVPIREELHVYKFAEQNKLGERKYICGNCRLMISEDTYLKWRKKYNK